MKRFIFLAVAMMCFIACSQEPAEMTASQLYDELQVSLDSDTRVQLNDSNKTVWNTGDLLSVYNFNDANECWKFAGATGDRSGVIRRNERVTPGADINKIVVVYPYKADYKLSGADKSITTTFPATQHYLENSYGLGENIMISTGIDDQVSLKSVCGWLQLKLTGNGSVRRIELYDNVFNQLNGNITINYETLVASFLPYSAGGSGNYEGEGVGGTLVDDTTLTLDCGAGGVALNNTTPKSFYFTLLPHTFAEGFTVKIIFTDGSSVVKSTSGELTISRNTITPLAAISVESEGGETTPDEGEGGSDSEPATPNNIIAYTTTDGQPVRTGLVFNESSLIDHKFENGEGQLIFSKEITKIGSSWFSDCINLKTIAIPNSVTKIYVNAFNNCTSLTGITIPDNVTWIDAYVFNNCKSLTTITIPESVTEIGQSVFAGCNNLTSFHGKFATADHRFLVIEEPLKLSKTLIAVAPAGLTEIVIPHDITKIEENTFSNNYPFTSLYCKATTPPTLAINNYLNGKNIYVPAESVDAYKAAAGWSDHADKIVGYDFDSDSAIIVFAEAEAKALCVANWDTNDDGELSYNEAAAVTDLGTVFKSNTTIKTFNELQYFTGLTSIKDYTFYNCSGLTSITIPKNVTEINIWHSAAQV